VSKYAGKSASVSIAGVTQPGRKWTWDSTTDEHEVTDFRAASSPASDGSVWHDWLVGFSGGTGTVEVVWDTDVAIPAHGASGTFIGLIGGGHGVSFTAFFLGNSEGADIKDAARRTLRFRQTGNPTFT
jgi:hypothetical protein